jgi:hypothetical protein
MQVGISEDALQDLNDGYLFYEAQRSGVGDYFSTCLRFDIDGLRVTGGIRRIVYRDYHRLLSKAFPYGIFYTVEEGRMVVVWAVVDLRRDPEWIREKLGIDS